MLYTYDLRFGTMRFDTCRHPSMQEYSFSARRLITRIVSRLPLPAAPGATAGGYGGLTASLLFADRRQVLHAQPPHMGPPHAGPPHAGPFQHVRTVVRRAMLSSIAVVSAVLVVSAPVQPVVAQVRFVDGDLVQVRGDDKIHLIEAGRRRWIADTVSLRHLAPDYSRLRSISFEELNAIPAGKPYRQFPLVRETASGRVYLVTRQTDDRRPRKHWINDLDSFSQLGFEWADVDTNAPVNPNDLPDAPTLSYRPVSKDQTSWTHEGVTLQVVPAWRLQVEDERLYLALALANTYNKEWREQVGPKLLSQGPWVEWGDLPEFAGGRYNVDLNRVTISSALRAESAGVLASVLSHEVFHAIGPHGDDAASCYSEEVRAFSLGAATWEQVPAKWRSATDWGRSLDALVKAWHDGTIERTLAIEPIYRLQCDR